MLGVISIIELGVVIRCLYRRSSCLGKRIREWSVNSKRCLGATRASYRFSAFWLRSKCSICSYQLNIWYDPHVGSTILNWFLDHGEVLGACSTFAADRPGIALPPGSVHEKLISRLKLERRGCFHLLTFLEFSWAIFQGIGYGYLFPIVRPSWLSAI